MQFSSLQVEFSGGNAARKTVGYLARPNEPNEPGEYPAVIVIHEIVGLVEHIKDVTRRFAKEGYVALAVDCFDGKTASTLDQGLELRGKLGDKKVLSDLGGGFEFLKEQRFVKPDRIGCIGFCMGGGFSFLFSCHNPELAACVVFYGRSPSPIDQLKSINCPLLFNYAGADRSISKSDIDLVKQTLAKYHKNFDLKVYPDVPHAFFNDTGQNYRPEEAKDAWARTLAFFSR